MRILGLVLLRLVLWVVVPVALVVLYIGPERVLRGVQRTWNWLTNTRDDPETILERVVKQHTDHVAAVRSALMQAEKTEAAIQKNQGTSEENIVVLEAEAQRAVARGDDLGARATLFKLNLERAALESFQEQLQRIREHMEETRRRLYLLELQLRQYEVGRSILLSQLAEAKTVEQQYAIANHFDPFSAISNWQRAEGMVQEKAINAHAAERVHADTVDLAVSPTDGPLDPVVLDAQLSELKALIRKVQRETGGQDAHESASEKEKESA